MSVGTHTLGNSYVLEGQSDYGASSTMRR